jgi:hypothetical protein
MSDALIFVFGMLATLFAVGPLAIAAASDLRRKDDEE